MHAILVPRGAEHKAVCRGLSRTTATKPLVLPIPIGPKPLARYLEKLQEGHFRGYVQPRVLLIGLCGSLSPHHAVGDLVIYQDCVYESPASARLLRTCDPEITNLLHQELNGPPEVAPAARPCKLKEKVSLVRALTSDRLIWSAAEKCELGKIYAASVVDMEGFAALEALSPNGIALAMVRVVSDDCHHNIPDLTLALSPNGSLQPFHLAQRLLRQPRASARLIRGALRGLQVLQQVTTLLFP